MKQHRDHGRRRSIRLRHYDYRQAGAYFITICTQNRACLFGTVGNGEMRLNDAGQMVERWWLELNRKFPMLETDEFLVMPNHFHGIVAISDVIVGADLGVGPAQRRNQGAHTGAPLPTVVQWFKTMTTNEYMRKVKTSGWPTFAGRFWQRNYYEHVIRSDKELTCIRKYIVHNPAQWELDRENPDCRGALQYAPTDDIETLFGGVRP